MRIDGCGVGSGESNPSVPGTSGESRHAEKRYEAALPSHATCAEIGIS